MGKAAIPGLGGGVVPPEANITQRTHASFTCSEVIYNFDLFLYNKHNSTARENTLWQVKNMVLNIIKLRCDLHIHSEMMK